LQRNIRRSAISPPRNAPYLAIAVAAYWLHVGVKRHAARPPMIGEIARWYARTNHNATRCSGE